MAVGSTVIATRTTVPVAAEVSSITLFSVASAGTVTLTGKAPEVSTGADPRFALLPTQFRVNSVLAGAPSEVRSTSLIVKPTVSPGATAMVGAPVTEAWFAANDGLSGLLAVM